MQAGELYIYIYDKKPILGEIKDKEGKDNNISNRMRHKFKQRKEGEITKMNEEVRLEIRKRYKGSYKWDKDNENELF